MLQHDRMWFELWQDIMFWKWFLNIKEVILKLDFTLFHSNFHVHLFLRCNNIYYLIFLSFINTKYKLHILVNCSTSLWQKAIGWCIILIVTQQENLVHLVSFRVDHYNLKLGLDDFPTIKCYHHLANCSPIFESSKSKMGLQKGNNNMCCFNPITIDKSYITTIFRLKKRTSDINM